MKGEIIMANSLKKYLEMTDAERNALHQQFLNEPDAFYEKAETDLLKESLAMSAKERFLAMTRLMKIGIMLKKAKIITPQPGSTTI